MLCASCGADNRVGRRFCARCGTVLPVVCPSCGFANDGSDAFCGGCGHRLMLSAPGPETRRTAEALARATPDAERRQITVVSATSSAPQRWRAGSIPKTSATMCARIRPRARK